MKLFTSLLFTVTLLVGCSGEEPTASENETKDEGTSEIIAPDDSNNDIEEEEKETTEVAAPVKNNNSLIRTDVDALFTVDPDEKQYENSQLEFTYGETVEVDYISYIGTGGIDYATAMFFEDKLVTLQLDTTLSDEELEKILGIDINEDLMVDDKRDRGVYEITFNGKFRENAIARYPFEMD